MRIVALACTAGCSLFTTQYPQAPPEPPACRTDNFAVGADAAVGIASGTIGVLMASLLGIAAHYADAGSSDERRFRTGAFIGLGLTATGGTFLVSAKVGSSRQRMSRRARGLRRDAGCTGAERAADGRRRRPVLSRRLLHRCARVRRRDVPADQFAVSFVVAGSLHSSPSNARSSIS